MNLRIMLVIAALGGFILSIVKWLCPSPLDKWVVGCLAVLMVGIMVGLWIAGRAWWNLKQLGITQICLSVTEDAKLRCRRFGRAAEIRMLIVKGDNFLTNHWSGLVAALANRCQITVLLATPGSELVREIEEMERLEGRGRRESIDRGIQKAKNILAKSLDAARKEVPAADQDRRLGAVYVGHYNTQYQESIVLCDDNWVWWTPHFTPANSNERPGFLAEGKSSTLRKLCDRHFRCVEKMSNVARLSPSNEPRQDQ